MKTIYENLIDGGYTDAELREAAKAGGGTREVSLAISDTPDGIPIVGIQYGCDFRAEEEWGVKELRDSLIGGEKHRYRMLPESHGKVGRFNDLPEGSGSLVLCSHTIENPDTLKWGHSIFDKGSYAYAIETGTQSDATTSFRDYYDEWWESQMPRTREYSTALSINRWTTVKELKEIGAKLGLTKFKRTKADILAQLHAADKPLNPDVWPGWFHYGKVFVARADSGVVASVLNMLYDAGKLGFLSQGGGSMLFGSGMSFYDSRDVGPELKRERAEYAEWYDAQMKALEPVAAELKKRGHGWYFLGKPEDGFKSLVGKDADEVKEETVYYWLNGHGRGPGYDKQPYGWYSLDELLAEKFVADINSK